VGMVVSACTSRAPKPVETKKEGVKTPPPSGPQYQAPNGSDSGVRPPVADPNGSQTPGGPTIPSTPGNLGTPGAPNGTAPIGQNSPNDPIIGGQAPNNNNNNNNSPAPDLGNQAPNNNNNPTPGGSTNANITVSIGGGQTATVQWDGLKDQGNGQWDIVTAP